MYHSLILARDKVTGGIGYQGKLPWKIPEDMSEFRRITSGATVIMGRNTFESIGKPLKDRENIVVSSKLSERKDVTIVPNLTRALGEGKGPKFVIGGVGLYKESWSHPYLESIYLTEVEYKGEAKYDTFLSEPIPSSFVLESKRVITTDKYTLTFYKYNQNRATSEQGYLSLLHKVLAERERRDDRTGTGTISLFGLHAEFDLTKGFPLITTKSVPLRHVFEELMWFLRGQTNVKILQEKGVHIWDGNSSPEYMKKIGLDSYPEGEMGPIYGAQWRNFGGVHDFKVERHIGVGTFGEASIPATAGAGVDQIADILHLIKTHPTSRRIYLSAWNPMVLKQVSLPSCHVSSEYYVRSGKYLDCKVELRSNDLFLGAPFNIASYALLVHMISAMTKLTPGRLVYNIGDTHIYSNHIDQVKEQLSRPTRELPKLTLLRVPGQIEDFSWEDVKVEGYHPHPSIKGIMAV